MAVFAAHPEGSVPGATAYIVLGLSVWLTYLADRLFDTQSRAMEQLISTRHRFAKRNHTRLWRIWLVILLGNVAIALIGLTKTQLLQGSILLLVALSYTLLNQLLSKRYFPKEIFVAGIFAAGTQVFIEDTNFGAPVILFGLLCLMNCLLIAEKEKQVDARLEVRSAIRHIPLPVLAIILLITLTLDAMSHLRATLLAPGIVLTLLFCFRHRITVESYRVLCDSALFIGPLVFFLT